MVKKKTCVFISGQGTNLKNLIFYSRNNNFPIKISLIISNNNKAYGLNYAKKYRIPFVLIDTKKRNYENKILLNLKKFNISFICLAGYMKIVSNRLIKEYKNRIINVHPSLLPKYKGLNTFARMLENKEKKAWSPILSKILEILRDIIIFLKSSARGCLLLSVIVAKSLIFLS